MTPAEQWTKKVADRTDLFCGDMPSGWAKQIEGAVNDAIREAVAEEREACAYLAETMGLGLSTTSAREQHVCNMVAEMIRKRG